MGLVTENTISVLYANSKFYSTLNLLGPESKRGVLTEIPKAVASQHTTTS